MLILLPLAAQIAWWIGGISLHFYGLVPLEGFYGPFYVGAYLVALVGGCIWPLLIYREMHFISYRPFLLPLIHGGLGIVFVAAVLFGFLPLFNQSGDGVRVLLRLVLVPLFADGSALVVRLADKYLLDGSVPGATRGYTLLPVSLTLAFVGRFFTTGLSSLWLTILLSVAVAMLEVVMRWTVVQRDAIGDKMFQWLQRTAWCSLLQRCGRRTVTHIDRWSPMKDAPAPELLAAARRPWSDLSPREQTARSTRANFAFIVCDTAAEDIGMLTLIPVAIFFRLPTRIGGQPLPLTDVLLRVGFQWLLELCTDVGPFLAYAVGRAWLSWRGDTLYRGVTRADVAAAGHALLVSPALEGTPMSELSVGVGAKLKPGGRELTLIDGCSSPGMAASPAVYAQRSLSTNPREAAAAASGLLSSLPPLVDDSTTAFVTTGSVGPTACYFTGPPTANGALLCSVSAGTVAAGRGESPLASPNSQTLLVGDSTSPFCALNTQNVHSHDNANAKAPSQPGSNAQSSSCGHGVCSCPSRRHMRQSLLGCVVTRDDAAALAHIQAARAPLLADDDDILWQRLPWSVVRQAMAPAALAGDWSWLHWFVYQNELLAARVGAAWRRRHRGWTLGLFAMVLLVGGLILRGYLATHIICAYSDAGGQRYWDACP
jgi:type IV secretory pathway VirB3-like protein